MVTKISRDSFNNDLRIKLAGVLDSGTSVYSAEANPYNYNPEFLDEFATSLGYTSSTQRSNFLTRAQDIANAFYLPNTNLGIINGVQRYALYRKPDTSGLAFWTDYALDRSLTSASSALKIAFFDGLSGDDTARSQTASKSFAAGTGDGDFYDRSGTPAVSGAAQFGYGTPLLQSTNVTNTDTVDDPEWDNIRLDIIKARTHQKGASWVSTNLGLQNDTTSVNNQYDVNSIDDPRFAPDKIKETVYNYYKARIADCETDRFLAHSSELETFSPVTSSESNLNFVSTAQWQFTMSFSSATRACQFFNSGGSMIFNFDARSLDVSGPQGKQSRDFVTMINGLGTLTFGATLFYNNHRTSVGSSTPTWASKTSSDSSYVNNNIKLYAFTNNASIGSASSVTIRMVINSGYDGGEPIGAGVGYGDRVKIAVEPSVNISRSNGVIVSPTPSNYSYGSWTSS